MSCYLSTSCFKNYELTKAIEECGKLSDKNVEISAPHPYQPIEDIKNILSNFKKRIIILLFITIFLHQRNQLF